MRHSAASYARPHRLLLPALPVGKASGTGKFDQVAMHYDNRCPTFVHMARIGKKSYRRHVQLTGLVSLR
jgi:hypothetical protein